MTPVNGGSPNPGNSRVNRRGRPASVPEDAGNVVSRNPKPASREKAHHQCPHCPQKYYGSHAMHDHIRSVHMNSVEKYYCPYCKKYYAWHQTLRKHLRDIHGVSADVITKLIQTTQQQQLESMNM